MDVCPRCQAAWVDGQPPSAPIQVFGPGADWVQFLLPTGRLAIPRSRITSIAQDGSATEVYVEGMNVHVPLPFDHVLGLIAHGTEHHSAPTKAQRGDCKPPDPSDGMEARG